MIMPLLHCKDCHHEWESINSRGRCLWCGGESYVLEEQTSLEKMMGSIDEIIEDLKNDLKKE
jgi:hypothetical protein